jgi:hypothetical protein
MNLNCHSKNISTGIPEIIIAKVSDLKVKSSPNLDNMVTRYKNPQANMYKKK